MHEMTFMEMMRISLVMPVLLFLSIVLVAVFLERLIYFSKNAKIDVGLFKELKKSVLAGKVAEAQQMASEGKGLIAQAMESILIAAKAKKSAELDNILGLYYQRIQSLLGRRLGLFGTFSFISPLLGLLGTVLGVMTAFRDLALSGSGGPMVVAAGISEALIATACGIAVAVSSALIYNYFNFKLKHVLNSLNIFGQELILMIESGQDI
jgi:biopolymer transport protein ExbB